MVLPYRGEPVLRPPTGGVGRVHRDHGQAGIVGHVAKPVPEPAGREAGDLAAERPAPASSCGPAGGPFASLAAGIGEVEVLDDHGAGMVLAGSGQDGGDRGPQPPVPCARGQARQGQADGVGDASLVAVRGQYGHRQVTGVHVYRHDSALPGLRQRDGLDRRRLPRSVQVPAAPHGVVGDVITDSAARSLRGSITAPVAEPDRARQPVTPAGPVGETGQRGGEPDLQPVLVGVPADRLVAPGLVLLPVSGQEQPGRGPSFPPLSFGETGIGEVASLAQQRFPAPAHAHPPGVQLLLHFGQPGAEPLDADGLGVPFRGGRVSAHPPGPRPRRHRQPGLDQLYAGQQGSALGRQVAAGELVGVLAGAGQRPSPPGRRLHRQLSLPHPPRPRPLLCIEPALRAPGGQVS